MYVCMYIELLTYIGALWRSNYHKEKVNIPKYKEHKLFYKKAIEMPEHGKEKIKAGTTGQELKVQTKA